MEIEAAFIKVPQQFVWDIINDPGKLKPLIDVVLCENNTGSWGDHLDGDLQFFGHPVDRRSTCMDSFCSQEFSRGVQRRSC